MATSNFKHPSDQDWEDNRDLLESLYDRNPLPKVMQHMKEHFGWDVNKRQYNKWLTTNWKVEKYVDSSKLLAIYPHVRDIQRGNKTAKVFIDGKKKSPKYIEKEMRRLRLKHPGLVTAAPTDLPKGVIVKECLYKPMPYITTELPFHDLEKHLQHSSPVPEHHLQQGFITILDGQEAAQIGDWILGSGAEKALQLVVPGDSHVDEHFDFSLMDSNTQFFASPLHRHILFSVANNFAGLGALPKEQVINFLGRTTSGPLYRMIRSGHRYYATQAIALNIFRAAIEVGDAKIVNFLLEENFPGIGVNRFICPYGGAKYTPIELAAGLEHTSVVKALLHHNPDVNLSCPDRSHAARKGAFNCAATGVERSWSHKRVAELDPELFTLLVYAGGQLDSYVLENLIKHDNKGEFTRLFISVQAAENHHRWNKWGTFCQVFKYQSRSIASDILDIMLDHMIDLNYGKWPRRIIDMVAGRGDLALMQKLLDQGVKLTGDTLPCAVSSGNEDLVRLLLQHCAEVNAMGDSQISPLAAAIRLQSTSMMELINCRVETATLSKRPMFQSVLKAASEVGSLQWIEQLVRIGGEVGPADLGTALVIAARDGRREVALALIDAGADTNIDSPSNSGAGPALHEALRRHDAVLVDALLNADANPNCDSFQDGAFSGKEPAISLAVS